MTKILLYIDPASTSAILYIIVAISATLAFALRGFFYKIKSFVLGKGFIKSDEFENIDVIFYSEGKQYWAVFYPIIKALENDLDKLKDTATSKLNSELKGQVVLWSRWRTNWICNSNGLSFVTIPFRRYLGHQGTIKEPKLEKAKKVRVYPWYNQSKSRKTFGSTTYYHNMNEVNSKERQK